MIGSWAASLAPSNVFLLLPAGMGLVYAVASIASKRAMTEGVAPMRVMLLSVVACAVVHWPLLLLAEPPSNPWAVHELLICGLLFATGMTLTFLAVSRGDVSVATPLLGTKVLFVAVFTVVLLRVEVRPSLWAGAALVALAVALLRGPGRGDHRAFWPTVCWAGGAALAFGICDAFVQAWRGHWGVGLFGPGLFTSAAGFCLLAWPMLPKERSRPTPAGRRWMLAGALLMGVQALGVATSLVMLDHPNSSTAVNIMYNSRVIWSVVLVWMVGGWFGNTEADLGRKTLAVRLVGAVLILAAIALVVVG